MMAEKDNRIMLTQEPVQAPSECDYSDQSNKIILDLDSHPPPDPMSTYHHQHLQEVQTYDYYIRDPQLNCSFQVNVPHPVPGWTPNVSVENTPPRFIAQYTNVPEVNIRKEDNPLWNETALQMEKGIDFCSQ